MGVGETMEENEDHKGLTCISESLQSIQESLEKEIQKFEELGKASLSPSDSYYMGLASPKGTTFHDPVTSEESLSNQAHVNVKNQNGILCQASQTLEVGELEFLKSKLEEVSTRIKAKDYQITQLESIVDGKDVFQEASTSTSESVQSKYREMEIELEGLFQQKIEYEIEQLIFVNMTQNLSAAEVDKFAMFEEQKHLAAEQMKMLHKLKDAEHRAVAVKNQAKELEGRCLATEEVLKMQNSCYELTVYFAAQILMLFIMFVIFQLRPQTPGVVPT